MDGVNKINAEIIFTVFSLLAFVSLLVTDFNAFRRRFFIHRIEPQLVPRLHSNGESEWGKKLRNKEALHEPGIFSWPCIRSSKELTYIYFIYKYMINRNKK